MSEILVIALIVAAVVIWFRMLAVKERALIAAKRHCAEMGVQFLDDSVVMSGLTLLRNHRSGSLAIAQRFRFEFTVTGDRRYRGETVYVGHQQISMHLEPHIF